RLFRAAAAALVARLPADRRRTGGRRGAGGCVPAPSRPLDLGPPGRVQHHRISALQPLDRGEVAALARGRARPLPRRLSVRGSAVARFDRSAPAVAGAGLRRGDGGALVLAPARSGRVRVAAVSRPDRGAEYLLSRADVP